MGTKEGAKKRWAKIYPDGVNERFTSKIKVVKECWMWTGTSTGSTEESHGTFWDGKKITLAHRYSLEQFLGRKLKRGMNALHTCDHPKCVRPAHLYEGTQSENNRDAYTRGRRSGKKQSEMLLAAKKKKQL